MKFLQKMKENKANNKGFSLVELIIVIAIMAILVGIVGTQVIPYLSSAKEGKDAQILSSYATAATTAYTSNADKVTIPASGSIVVNAYKTGLSGDEATLQTAIQGLTYTALPTTKFSSDDGKKILGILITYDFTNKTITVQGYEDAACTAGKELLDPVVSDM